MILNFLFIHFLAFYIICVIGVAILFFFPESLVIFSVARSSKFGPYEKVTNITYDHIFVNIGNGFNNETSAFKAPCKGVYWFTFTARGPYVSTYKAEDVSLVHNGNNVVRASVSWLGTGGNTIALILEAGDLVWTRMHVYIQKELYSNYLRYITFSGYLMSPLF